MNVSLIACVVPEKSSRNFRPYRTSDTEYLGNRLPVVISIDPRTLPRILRIEGLIPFTQCYPARVCGDMAGSRVFQC